MAEPAWTPLSTRIPRPPGSRYSTTSPGLGRNPGAGSSALIRNSMAWPRDSTESKESSSPRATRNCSLARSMPVTISVMVCSTWRRVFISRKKKFAVWCQQELDGAGVLVVGGGRHLERRLAERLALLGGDHRRRGLLDQLLVAALQRAIPFAQEHAVAVLVDDDLGLDVAGPLQVPLDVHLGVGEVGVGLAAGGLEGVGEFGGS